MVGSPPSSWTSNDPSSGRQARYSSSLIHVLPRGDEQVLHHGHARLQWLVVATYTRCGRSTCGRSRGSEPVSVGFCGRSSTMPDHTREQSTKTFVDFVRRCS